MEGKFDGIYMNHPTNKHDEWDEEKNIHREAYKRAGPRVKGMVKNQVEIVEVKKNLNMSAHIHSALINDCGTSQADIKKILGLYNQSN